MTIRRSSLATLLTLGLGVALASCGSDDGETNTGTGGTSARGGSGGGSARGGTGGGSSTSTGGGSGTSTGGSVGSNGGAGGSSTSTGGAGGGSGGSAGGAGGGGAGGSSSGSGGSMGRGGSGGGAGDARAEGGATEGGSAGEFTITGDFSMMGMNKCFKMGNTRTTGQKSPAIMWTGAPADTKSFAVSLRDLQGGIHWVMWNIPPTEAGLAAALPAGAMPGAPAPMGSRQTGTWFGPGAGAVHRYEYQVWALKVAEIPGGSTGALYNMMLPAQRIASAKIHACGNADASCAGCPAGPNP